MKKRLKTIIISEKLHKEIKLYCVKNNFKLNNWIEKELEKIIRGNDNK